MVIRNVHVVASGLSILGLWWWGNWSLMEMNAAQVKLLALRRARAAALRGQAAAAPRPTDVQNRSGGASKTQEAGFAYKLMELDWQDTTLGPGYPTKIHSAWSDLGVLRTGDIVRIEADGFNGKDHPQAGWGWYLNIWSGDGRHWEKSAAASRLLHLNPRPRGKMIAMNHCLKGAWGKEKDVPVPDAWRLENAGKYFMLELELGDRAWALRLNGVPQPGMAYDRKGNFSGPLTLQLYDVLGPRVILRSRQALIA